MKMFVSDYEKLPELRLAALKCGVATDCLRREPRVWGRDWESVNAWLLKQWSFYDRYNPPFDFFAQVFEFALEQKNEKAKQKAQRNTNEHLHE